MTTWLYIEFGNLNEHLSYTIYHHTCSCYGVQIIIETSQFLLEMLYKDVSVVLIKTTLQSALRQSIKILNMYIL